MLTIFNRFIDWFFMKGEGDDPRLQGPQQLMHGVSDVTVLVAEPAGKFANDEAKNILLQSIIEPLNSRDGLSLRPIAKSFVRKSKGDLTEQFDEVLDKGRQLLEKERADLLLWGEVQLDLQSVRWYFLSAEQGEANLGVPGLAESILVPFAPEAPILDVLYAALFAATRPTHSTHAAKIGEYLLGAIDPLTKLPAGLSNRKTPAPAKTSVMGMCAVVLANIARRGEELGWFDPAIKAFETWEGLIEKDKSPLEWALVKNHHGWLFEEMAHHGDDKQALEHIENALKIFEEVCGVFNPRTYPLEWAAVQLRMAGTCARVGRTRSETDYLKKAAVYYKKAMEIYTQEAYPLNWADVMSRMAKTLMLHGQMVKGAQSLEQAGVAFQAVLKVYTEEKHPVLWASTQNNLGATLFGLAKRDANTPEWLDHALVCFQEARRYYEANGKTKLVHVIDKNIAKAQSLKEQRDEEKSNDLLS